MVLSISLYKIFLELIVVCLLLKKCSGLKMRRSLQMRMSDDSTATKESLKSQLKEMGALYQRGELEHDRTNGVRLASLLEESSTMDGDIEGQWDLIYSSSPFLFMSSPFFMAARAVCKESEEVDRFFWFCRQHRDALAFTSIGRVSQIISGETLVSEFESNVAAVPGLPVIIKGTIESTAEVEFSQDNDCKTMTFLMDTVRIKKGTSNIPVLDSLLDSFEGLKTRELGDTLERVIQGYSNPRPSFRTYFIDDEIRVSRDIDDNVFVYKRR